MILLSNNSFPDEFFQVLRRIFSSVIIFFGVFGFVYSKPHNEYERIVIMTDEFDHYRRIILTAPYSVDIFTEVRTEPSKGEFAITLFPVDTGLFISKKSIKKSGVFPVRLTTTFLDSLTILIEGKTVPYKSLISYNIIEEDLIIFDIYDELPMESFFREQTITIHSIYQKPAFGDYKVEQQNNVRLSSYSSGKRSIRGELIKNRFAAAMVFSGGIVLAFTLGIMGTFYWTTFRKGRSQLKKGNPFKSNGKVFKKESGAHSLTKIEGRQAAIRQLMADKNISFDEAAILMNLPANKVNVKA